MSDQESGPVRIIGPDEGDSHWQPVPANGYVRNILSSQALGSRAPFAMGTQTVAPGCFIREHVHDRHEEAIFLFSGRAVVKLDGTDEHDLVAGSAVFIGINRRHKFINRHEEPFTFLWVMMPGGLDVFFAEIGRPRSPGQPAPEPFPRPANVAEIEARTVFGWTDQSFHTQDGGKAE